jgi:hypothetical protein
MNRKIPEPLSDAQVSELRALVASLDFVFAKTMAEIPHWYITRFKYPDAYQTLSLAIRQHGIRGEFAGRRYRYMHLDGWKYWEFWPVINRVEAIPSESPCGAPR